MTAQDGVLRQAVAADIPGIFRVRYSVRENRLTSMVISDEDCRREIEDTGRGWVITVSGEVVAFAIGNKVNGSIWALFVDPAYERRGFGRRLHDEMLGWMWAQGLARIWLSTSPSTRAEQFYLRAGWMPAGTTPSGEVRFELARPAQESLTARIAFLADHPQTLPFFEQLFQTEWADYYGPGGRGSARDDLLACSNHDRLPIGLIAFIGAEPCGIAMLKAESVSTHQQLSPWIGGGMVAPRFRRHGIGAQLAAALEQLARDLGYKSIYAGTSTANSLLTREGWRFIEQVSYDGETVSIYEKLLSQKP